MNLTDATVKQFATVGAAIRLRELDAERARILMLFPELQPKETMTMDLDPVLPTPVPEKTEATDTAPVRRRRKLSPDQKAAIAVRMRKYWKTKRAEKKATGR